MMAGVNNAKDYYTLMKFGHQDPDTGAVVVTNTILQGGIVSVYYLGTLVGALGGGKFSDRYGRIKSIALGAAWAVLGASLQTSAQNHVWMICARLVNGIGTGILNAIVPVYATETADYTSRGQFVAIEFTLNIFGVVVAYWLEFGCSKYKGGDSAFTWRFPIGFQIIPLLFLLAICWIFPESPRYLTKVGRGDEARYILGRLRGEHGEDEGKAEAEYQDIQGIVELEKDTADEQHYYKMLFGIGSGKLHTGRRVQLVIWLQIMQEWIGIGTVYTPALLLNQRPD
jgi:MFS family permease